MRSCARLIVVSTVLVAPALAHAQDTSVSASVTGTISDASGAVLPGATVRAVHEATGNAFETVTDDRGSYRLPVRVGTLQITAALSDFRPATRSVELLLGQTAVVNLQLSIGGVAETVTVTGAAPLIETTTSVLGGNVDSRQMQELPVNGRNWMTLAMLAPGSRTVPVAASRAESERPLPDRNNNDHREFRSRVQQRIPLPGRASIDATAEAFNIFDRPNYDLGTEESQTRQYLQPINAQYRGAQVGFRLTF